jgi:phosphoserine phosphatase RsbU/P
MSKRHLIGLLTNDLVGTYQFSFWAGMKAAAREEDCDVASFNGGELGSCDPNKYMRNSVFEFVNEAKPDALILLAPVVANSTSFSQIEAFVRSFGSIPLITVGIEIPGHPLMAVNNASGMDSLVEHLVTVHERKRFAFVGGPVQNPDAQQRRDTFLRVLARHDIEFDPNLDLVGQFDFGITRQKVAELLRNGAEFDALVAANDEMALGAMDALKEFGRRVPDDVVVTGFDDIDESSNSMPALTTVRQPVFEQGKTSLLLALDRIDGTPVAPVTTQMSSLVRRGSCGCLSSSIAEAARRLPKTNLRTSPVTALGSPEHIESVHEQCAEVVGGSRYAPQLEDLVKAMAADCLKPGSDTARSAFLYLVESAAHADEENDRWQTFLSRLRIASLRFLPSDPATIFSFEGLVHQMRAMSQERATQSIAANSAQLHRWARSMHESACRMLEKFDDEHMFQTLAHDARSLQISTLQFLVREPSLSEGEFRLALSIVRGARIGLPPKGGVISFGSALRAITKRSVLRSAVAVEPLYFGGEQLGFLMMEMDSRRGALMDSLRGQISASLMGSRIVNSALSAPAKGRRNEPILV